MVISVVALALVLVGCAKSPGTTGASTAAPDSRVDAGAASAIVPAAEQGAPARASSPLYGRAERPSPKDFVSVPDLLDIHFDFDRSDIRPAAAQVLEANARWLKAHPDHLILIEGHTDERGTNEYNLALGDRRATSSMSYLVSHGVQAGRITVISYGEDRPVCEGPHEGCWSRNRRAHFAVKPR
jgi:peptidoglycan-associated lipoprotein